MGNIYRQSVQYRFVYLEKHYTATDQKTLGPLRFDIVRRCGHHMDCVDFFRKSLFTHLVVAPLQTAAAFTGGNLNLSADRRGHLVKRIYRFAPKEGHDSCRVLLSYHDLAETVSDTKTVIRWHNGNLPFDSFPAVRTIRCVCTPQKFSAVRAPSKYKPKDCADPCGRNAEKDKNRLVQNGTSEKKYYHQGAGG